MTNLEPEREMMNFLRNRLTDYNSSNRSGQWIYDDWPRDDLNVTTGFPRVVVHKLDENGDLIGMADNDTWDPILLQIDILVHHQTPALTLTVTDEAVGTIANSPRINFDYLAAAITNIKHNTVAFGVTTKRVNDADFTTPSAGTVEWGLSSGNMNFSAADLASYAGQSITASYTYVLEGEMLALRIGRDIIKAVRSYWRTDKLIGGLHNPKKLSGPRVLEFDKAHGWHRVMVEYQFHRFNTGEEV